MSKSINKAVSSAPAKVILFGEHFVVYNNPAIVAAINKRIHVNAQTNSKLHINIKSGENSICILTKGNADYLRRINPILALIWILILIFRMEKVSDHQQLHVWRRLQHSIPYFQTTTEIRFMKLQRSWNKTYTRIHLE